MPDGRRVSDSKSCNVPNCKVNDPRVTLGGNQISNTEDFRYLLEPGFKFSLSERKIQGQEYVSINYN